MSTDFQFAAPWLFTLLAIVPLLAWWQRPQRGGQPASLRFSSIQTAITTPRSWRVALMPLLTIARLAAIALLIVGLARPQLVQARDIIHGEGVDIALALDISGSMASLDFEPQNRLEAAKEVIARFIGERIYDRIGLVVFASNAFSQSPPTSDHNVLRRLIEETKLATDLGIDDGTAIGMGLANAANMLKDSTVASRVVILLTDGVNNTGEIDPLTAAAAAKTLGLKVYTIGMGRPGPVPVPVSDIFGNKTLAMQESTLDEATLLQIADATGGRYYRAEDTKGLRQIYDEINQLEKSQIDVQTYTKVQELANWLFVPGLALLLIELLLRNTYLRTLP